MRVYLLHKMHEPSLDSLQPLKLEPYLFTDSLCECNMIDEILICVRQFYVHYLTLLQLSPLRFRFWNAGSQTGRPLLALYSQIHECRNWESGAAQFHFWLYINRIFCTYSVAHRAGVNRHERSCVRCGAVQKRPGGTALIKNKIKFSL